MTNLAIHDDDMHTAMNQVKLLNGDPRTGHMTSLCTYDVIACHENIFVNNSSHNQGRAVGELSLCLCRQDASIGTRYDLPE